VKTVPVWHLRILPPGGFGAVTWMVPSSPMTTMPLLKNVTEELTEKVSLFFRNKSVVIFTRYVLVSR
jgi:hypothetical protein